MSLPDFPHRGYAAPLFIESLVNLAFRETIPEAAAIAPVRATQLQTDVNRVKSPDGGCAYPRLLNRRRFIKPTSPAKRSEPGN